MTLTEARTPPADYLPDRNPFKLPPIPKPRVPFNDLATVLVNEFPCYSWALRHWRTGHNCHVEHWHGVSLPGRAR